MKNLLVFTLSLVVSLLLSCAADSASTKTTTKNEKAVKEDVGRLIDDAMTAYGARQYERARELFQKVVKEKPPKSNLIKAHKHLAFIYGIHKNPGESKREFIKAFELDPDFKLDKAEQGNPFWGPAFENASRDAALIHASAKDLLNKGKEAYGRRAYDEALTFLQAALDKKDIGKSVKVESCKYAAFVYALKKQTADAKKAFRMAFETDKNFELDKAEYGNPVWTPLFDGVKKEFKK